MPNACRLAVRGRRRTRARFAATSARLWEAVVGSWRKHNSLLGLKNYVFGTPAPLLLDNMEQTRYTTESAEAYRDAFWRIAKPYSGAASRVVLAAKVERGEIVTNSLRS